jgi:hypothetical protein
MDNPQLECANEGAFSFRFVPVYHRKNGLATGFAGFFFPFSRVNLYNLESFPLLKNPIL